MKVNGFSIFLIIFLATLMATSLFYPLRYIKYLLPLLPLPLLFHQRKGTVDRSVFEYYYTFIAFYLCTIAFLFLQNLVSSEVSQRFLPNAVFIVSPLVFLALILPYFKQEKVDQYVKLIFFVNILMFFNEEGTDLMSALTNFGILKTAIISSEFPTESNLAYAFGFLVIYFYIEKYPLRYKLLAFIFFVLCFKRIVIAAVLVSCVSYFLIRLLHINVPRFRKLFVLIGLAINLLFIKFTQLIVSGEYDKLVFEKTGLSTDRFMMGRKTFYTEVYEQAGTMSWTGLGLGKIDDIMFNLYGMHVNLHSEVLKNYFEFGLIIFTVWLLLIFYKNLFSLKAAMMLMYINILLLTDNVFIYFEVMFYFYFFILIFLNDRLQQYEVQKT